MENITYAFYWVYLIVCAVKYWLFLQYVLYGTRMSHTIQTLPSTFGTLVNTKLKSRGNTYIFMKWCFIRTDYRSGEDGILTSRARASQTSYSIE